MKKIKSDWMKRGICLALAGALVLCSENVSYAAFADGQVISEALAAEDSKVVMETEKEEPGIQEAAVEETTEIKDSTEDGNAARELADGTEESLSEDVSSTEELSDGIEKSTEETLSEGAGGTEELADGTEEILSEGASSTEGLTGSTEKALSEGASGTEELADGTEETSSEEAESGRGFGEVDIENTEELTEEVEVKAEKIPKGITLRTESNYKEMFLGEKFELPSYTIQYTDPNAAGTEAAVEWSTDGLGIVALAESGNSVTGVKPGVTALKLTVKGTDIFTEYYVIVAPEAPASASVDSLSCDAVGLAWGEVQEAAGYAIYRKAENEGDFKVIAHVDGGSTTRYKDSSEIKTGTKYTYRIAAYVQYKDEAGTVKYAESQKFAQIVAEPSLGKVGVSGAVAKDYDTVVVSWNALEGADGYAVYRASGSSEKFANIGETGADMLSYTDIALSAGATYRYKVRGYRTIGGGKIYGEDSEIVTAKPMPSASVIKAQVKSDKAVKLSWESVNGADGYALYRKASGEEAFKRIKNFKGGSNVSYTDKNVKTGTKYSYKVKAYCTVEGSKVWGGDSNEVSATPAIAAPSGVTLTNQSYNSIRIRWKRVSQAEGYRVLRASSANGKYKTIATVKGNAALSYTDKKLAVGKTYFYKVCAYNAVNGKTVNGQQSKAAEAKAVAPAVKVKSEAAGASAVKLTWSKVTLPSKNSGYNIYRVEDGKSKKIKSCNYKTTAYTVKDLIPGVKYTFKVVPYVRDSEKNAVFGLDSNLITAAPKLLAVTIEKAESDVNGNILVTWKATKDGGEEKYVVYRASSKKGSYRAVGSVERKEGVADYSFADKDTSFGKNYYYKVLCTKTLSDGTVMKSGYSAIQEGKSAPAAPTLTVTEGKSESFKLSWERIKVSSGKYVSGYAIYRSNTEKGSYKKIKTISNGKTTQCTDAGLVTGTVYYYKIRSYYKYGGKNVYSSYSEPVSKQSVPEAPVIEAESLDYQTVRISWKPVAGCSGYQVRRSDSPYGTFKSVKNINSAKTLYYDNSGLTAGKDYYYQVRAFVKKDGKKVYGAYSDVKAAKPLLGKPLDLSGTAVDNNQIKLTWKAVEGAKTYTIVRSNSVDGSYKIASEICNTNFFLDSSVTMGTTYYYKVKAVRDGMESEFTNPIGVTATAITLSADSVTMKTGSSMKLTASVHPSAYVSWSSDNPQIAVVTSDGTVYALKEGTATINATASGVTKKVTVTVKDKIGTENKGIEISSENGTVDFNAVRSAGYEYVMLRITNGVTEDKNFRINLKGAKEAGLKVGVSCYSKAQTKAAAVNEAKKVLSILNGEKLDYPVVYDLEDISLLYNNVTKAERTEFVTAFRSEIINAGKGYQFILGLSQSLLKEYPNKYMDTSKLAGIDIWVYNCRTESLGHGYQGTGTVVMWRYTDSGTVNGINGKVCISNRYRAY